MKKLLKKMLMLIGSLFKIKNVLIFESHADYSDSSRTFYEYLIKNNYNKKYKMYWFVNDEMQFKDRKTDNVRFITMWKNDVKRTFIQWIKYFWIVKNAKYLIFSNRTLCRINKKTKTVYINHGIAIKKIKGKRITPIDIDYRVDSSEFCANLVMDQQGLRREQIIVVGNPRNDVMFTKTDIEKKMHDFMNYSKRILWLPTFRKSAYSDRTDSTFDFPMGIPIIYNESDLLEVNDLLKANNIILILKLHPAQDTSNIRNINLSNITLLDDNYLITHDAELTELYKITDALITDYSCVYVDFLLENRPIGFTQDDFKEYVNGFSMDNINDYMPGEKIINVKDLKKFINDLADDHDKYKSDRKRINKIFNEFSDGNSSKRLAEKLDL